MKNLIWRKVDVISSKNIWYKVSFGHRWIILSCQKGIRLLKLDKLSIPIWVKVDPVPLAIGLIPSRKLWPLSIKQWVSLLFFNSKVDIQLNRETKLSMWIYKNTVDFLLNWRELILSCNWLSCKENIRSLHPKHYLDCVKWGHHWSRKNLLERSLLSAQYVKVIIIGRISVENLVKATCVSSIVLKEY